MTPHASIVAVATTLLFTNEGPILDKNKTTDQLNNLSNGQKLFPCWLIAKSSAQVVKVHEYVYQ